MKFASGSPGWKGKRRSDFFSKTAMTLAANVNLPVARKPRRIRDRFACGCSGVRALPLHMCQTRAMAAFAGYSQNKIVPVITIHQARRSERFKVGGVAFDASGNYRPIKICRAVQISRTIDPVAQFRPVRNRELKKLISFPIQIGLSFSSGSNHDAKRFRMFFGMRRFPDNDRLIKNAILGVHSERKCRVDRLHDVFGWHELPGNGVSGGELGGAVMRRKLKCFEFAVMARAADIVSDVTCLSRVSRQRWRNTLATGRDWKAAVAVELELSVQRT